MTVVRRRTRLARGPVTIGEPAPIIDARLAASEPYRPDTVVDGGSALGLTVRAASVRGLYKRYEGAPRQDDLCLGVHDGARTLIVAVADGVSGAPRSHLGAALAVRHAATAVARQLDRGRADLDWRQVFDHAAWALVEEHRRDAGDSGAGVEEAAASLATTLVVAAITVPDVAIPAERAAAGGADADGAGGADLDGAGEAEADGAGEAEADGAGEAEAPPKRSDHTPDSPRVQVAAVGDSPALLLSEAHFEAVVAEPERADGLVGGGVEALPRAIGAIRTTDCTLASGSVLLVCTDGLALPLADGNGEVGRTLVRELSTPPDIIDFARLLDFSRSTYDDDRSLVAVWNGIRP